MPGPKGFLHSDSLLAVQADFATMLHESGAHRPELAIEVEYIYSTSYLARNDR
jgi:hypothetical protein